MKKYRVRYSPLFVNAVEAIGEFTFHAEDDTEARDKASKVMMAKSKKLGINDFRMNIEEVPE